MSQRTFDDDRYETMNYRRSGRSGLLLPAVSLGFWQALGEAGAEETCREVCYTALDNGLTHFDLANNYGKPGGHSEQVVGRILKDMPRDELIVSTKAGYRMWPGPYGDHGSKKYLVASLDQSLQRLGLDYVDIFYHHRPDAETPLEETLGALDLVVRQGKALYAGVSNYTGPQFRDACDVIARHDWTPITIHQPCYNMISRKPATDLFPQTAATGTGVITFSPLAQGRLTDRYLDGLPEDSRWGKRGRRGKQWYAEQEQMGIWEMARRLREVAQRRGQTLAQLAITWQLTDPRVTSVLVGVSKVEQLEENVAAANAEPLSDEEMDEIESILND